MKPSPLQLKWITYPELSYEVRDEFRREESLDAYAVALDQIEINYRVAGESVAYLRMCTDDASLAPYRMRLVAVAAFNIDHDRVRDAYPNQTAAGLSVMAATNVARIVYASAREQVAMLTARAPHGSMVIQSVLIEPGDVAIDSPSDEPDEVLRHLFGASDEELGAIRSRALAAAQDEARVGQVHSGHSPAAPASKPKKAKAAAVQKTVKSAGKAEKKLQGS